MIVIHAELGRDLTFSISADGHAHAARNEEDHDLVCCAVSTIMCTLATSCANVEEVNTVYHTSSGHAMVTVTDCMELWCEIAARFQMAVDGLMALGQQYPQSIRMTVEN